MKRNRLHISSLLLIVLTSLYSCSSVSYFKKHNLQEVQYMVEKTVLITGNTDSILHTEKHLNFTKNGRVESSFTLNNNKDTIQTTEKKLFFEKQTHPDLPNYYCKTRWKTKHRERISCYSQKKYKQNEKIVYYSKNGKILKEVDHFKTFNTHYYNYNNETLQSIVIKDTTDTVIDSIAITCLKTDEKNNCITLEKRHTKSDSILRVYRQITY
ncbi:conserved hypothetical protein [Formosa agariphila KMM 3901]|uniref:Lipoprotein n=1 Tax=Formosa agariphila (strain DSM 15362 / KCTC 12365 / LMG 23005 / KMM 3901 / M-2Alg 35-1) TaxID=1347342 RepID=T2KKH4_FORAG|nr:hypothetical protein [Formosa agariphila]CDF78943.1 conserved hypothetical protein [Formosa agariphila KMM 3901]